MKQKNPILYSLLEYRYFMQNEFDLLFEDKKWWETAWDAVKDYAAQVGEGGAEVIDMAKEAGEGIAANPTEFAKNYFKDLFTDPETYHSGAALASTVPGYGDAASLLDAALYAAQGDADGAKLALLASIPFVGTVADAKRVEGALARLEKIGVNKADDVVRATKELDGVESVAGKDYLKTTSIPGAKEVKVPPKYSPERPGTVQKSQIAEPVTPKPEEFSKPKPDYTPWTPKPAKPPVTTPKPTEPVIPAPVEPAIPSPKPTVPEPYTPPAVPQPAPKIPLPPRIPQTPPGFGEEEFGEEEFGEEEIPNQYPGDAPTRNPGDAPTRNPGDAPISNPGDSPTPTSISQPIPSGIPAIVPVTQPVTQPELQKTPPDTKTTTKTGEEDEKESRQSPKGGPSLENQIPKFPSPGLAGDLTGKDIGLALSKILGKYSGTSRIR